MEEQKDTKNIWIVMTITFFTVSIVFGILLYRSEKVIKEMQQTVAESVTVQEQQDVNASADPVRLMDGMVQVQKDTIVLLKNLRSQIMLRLENRKCQIL